jgi:hypothetical protein
MLSRKNRKTWTFVYINPFADVNLLILKCVSMSIVYLIYDIALYIHVSRYKNGQIM